MIAESHSPLSQLELHNGLKVVLSPHQNSPLVAVAVHYGVGFRSEPEGRSGFAHLFEHLMFQGSTAIAPGEHFRIVQAVGGQAGGSTRQDYTEYHQIAPAAALERLLFLEADRMRAPRLGEATLAAQLDVVKNEIRLRVRDRAYGGFPWTTLPAALYRGFANAHDGYGNFTDLERATVDDCAAFFDRHYTPGNAVLTVAGHIDPDRTAVLVERHFGDIPARPAAPAPFLAEPAPTAPVRRTHHDAHAPLPATALGLRLPDPAPAADDRARYPASLIVARLLAGDGPAGLRALAHRRGLDLATATAQCGFFGPYDARDPDTFVVTARHPRPVHEQFADLVVDALTDLADGAVPPDEAEHAATALAARWSRDHDHLLARARTLGRFRLLHRAPERVAALPGLLRRLDPAVVREAAGELSRAVPGLLTVRPAEEAPLR
ncbi:M16 family metallopeptidase [Streptomyces sp. NPDC127106]|uniref:M16 family metallopeptidase n=1 Tax=Streptomyces sp. NPDC127106 TaxID=3345360 RepID=UPI0036363B6D